MRIVSKEKSTIKRAFDGWRIGIEAQRLEEKSIQTYAKQILIRWKNYAHSK